MGVVAETDCRWPERSVIDHVFYEMIGPLKLIPECSVTKRSVCSPIHSAVRGICIQQSGSLGCITTSAHEPLQLIVVTFFRHLIPA
jgi:hypothetical protein